MTTQKTPAESDRSYSTGALSTLGVLKLTWKLSGGLKNTFLSFDFAISVVVLTLCSPFWMTQKWPDQVIAVLPNLLGFTLSGFAIFLSLGADGFKELLAGKPGDRSPYLSVCSAFMWFITIQVTSLCFALVASAMYFDPPSWLRPYKGIIQIGSAIGSAIGYWLFCYSLLLIFRAAIRIFKLGRWYNDYIRIAQKDKQ